MEKVVEQIGNVVQDNLSPDDGFTERRASLARLYHSLPTYGSSAFWQLLAAPQEGQALPLEVLVRILREAVARMDRPVERRLFEIIITRVQMANEQWVHRTLACTRFLAGEQRAMGADLYADLCELLLRLLRDPGQRFWEEHFQHSLRFARKHAFERFMRYEGYLSPARTGSGRRVPHTLMASLERAARWSESDEALEVCDERAEAALRAVEQEGDIAALMVRLPARLRVVVWLVFWEDHTLKTVGELLNISTHTVRNRLRAALAELREALEAGREVLDD